MHEPGPPHLSVRTWPGELPDAQDERVRDAEGERYEQCGDTESTRRGVAQLRDAHVDRGGEAHADGGDRRPCRVGAARGDRRLAAGGERRAATTPKDTVTTTASSSSTGSSATTSSTQSLSQVIDTMTARRGRAQAPPGQSVVTKSISSSTRPRSSGSRSVKLFTRARMRCAQT